MRSMTGYGRATITSPLGELVIEVHGVNRRTLEINVQAGKEFLPFDLDMRKKIGGKIFRGQVTLRITREFGNMPTGEALQKHLAHLKNEWEVAAKGVGLSGDVTLAFLASQMEEMPLLDFDEAGTRERLLSGLNQALEKMVEMKDREGKSLAKDIHDHLQALEKEISVAESCGKESPEKLREKLTKKLEDLSIHDDDRVARETVIFAERADITEEIVRLRSHIEQFATFFSKKNESIGRSLDFLVQEMNREANTIASKAAEIEVKQAALNLKSGIEKIREQVQNLE